MSVNRNQPCPCGSGKKYKKCCIHKENVIQLHEVKEERFYQQKQKVVEKLKPFLDQKLSFNELSKLETEFKERTNRIISEKLSQPFFRFWLQFFYRFENGLRGIEWFYEENHSKLLPAELAMLKKWIELRPTLVQAIEIQDEVVIFEDVLTKKTYPVANSKENLFEAIPWYGTFGLVEEYEDKFYFNGVRSYIGPKQIERTTQKIKELVAETNLTIDEVMLSFFPEILAESLQDKLSSEDEKQKVLTEYFATFKVKSAVEALSYFAQHPEIDQQDNIYNWTGNWEAYRDSELVQQIGIGEVFGSFSIEKDVITFNTFSEPNLEEFTQLLENNLDVERVNVEEKHLTIPFNAEVRNLVLSMDKTVPGYFSLYAQQSKLLEVDAPIPAYDDLSLRQLVEQGREKDADLWLKQSEYDLYRHVFEQFKKIDITADFNTIRRQLNLPLSPFVTGGGARSTSLVGSIKSEDINLLEELGFTPTTVNHFYTNDILNFYKEKTVGKGKATVRKYQLALHDFRAVLEQIDLTNWNQFNQSIWEELISVLYPNMFESMNKTQIKDFLSTLKAFTKMLDERYDTNFAKDVAALAKDAEQKMINMI